VGQIRLARAWEEALAPHGITTAQILLTLDDSGDRRRYLNTRATLAALLGLRRGADRQRERHHRHRRDPLWRQ
jgi:glutamate 5-kinase